MYKDKKNVCRKCGKEFILTASEQKGYAIQGHFGDVNLCRACIDADILATTGLDFSRGPVELVCSRCGVTFKAPCTPKDNRAVYCTKCFAHIRSNK